MRARVCVRTPRERRRDRWRAHELFNNLYKMVLYTLLYANTCTVVVIRERVVKKKKKTRLRRIDGVGGSGYSCRFRIL